MFIAVSNKTLSEHEVLASALLFFFAGYDTTGLLLTFASYCLATNVDVQERLYHELAAATRDRALDHDAVLNNEYLDAVVSETLRLYPPAIFVGVYRGRRSSILLVKRCPTYFTTCCVYL